MEEFLLFLSTDEIIFFGILVGFKFFYQVDWIFLNVKIVP